MPKKLDPQIAEVLKKYGFGAEACWDCHGTWVVLHKALEQIAGQAGIVFDQPQIIEADSGNKIASICVNGRLGDVSAWSIGEAAPANNKNAYPWAMAEKRAKDRVILKLVGLHGFVYSEEEADDFKDSRPKDVPIPSGALTKTAARNAMMEFSRMIHSDEETPDVQMLDAHIKDHHELISQVIRDWPDWWHGKEGTGDGKGAEDRIQERRDILRQKDNEDPDNLAKYAAA